MNYEKFLNYYRMYREKINSSDEKKEKLGKFRCSLDATCIHINFSIR